MNGAIWTDADDAEMKDIFAKGGTDNDLSDHFNRSRNAISARRTHLKLVRVRHYQWPPEKVATLTQMWMNGDRLKDIIAKIGCSEQTARAKAYKLDLPRRGAAANWKNRDVCQECGANFGTDCPVPRCPQGVTLAEPAPYPNIKSSMGMF